MLELFINGRNSCIHSWVAHYICAASLLLVLVCVQAWCSKSWQRLTHILCTLCTQTFLSHFQKRPPQMTYSFRPQIFSHPSCLNQILSFTLPTFASVPSLLSYFCPSLSFFLCLCFSLLCLLIHPPVTYCSWCLFCPSIFTHLHLLLGSACLRLLALFAHIRSQVTKVRKSKLLTTEILLEDDS